MAPVATFCSTCVALASSRTCHMLVLLTLACLSDPIRCQGFLLWCPENKDPASGAVFCDAGSEITIITVGLYFWIATALSGKSSRLSSDWRKYVRETRLLVCDGLHRYINWFLRPKVVNCALDPQTHLTVARRCKEPGDPPKLFGALCAAQPFWNTGLKAGKTSLTVLNKAI